MIPRILLITVLFAGISACGADEGSEPDAVPASESGLSQAQLENGIGPITTVDLGPIDEALAAQGASIFAMKCAACHKFDQRYVGPSLEGLLERRTPAFVMNMVMNPAEMVEKHPDVKQMLTEFLTPMPNQNVNEADARAILEYIRQVEEEKEDDEREGDHN